ncbi:3-oxoacyl-ACP reductase FabG [Oscillochloris sp. ZM17-4]|uniref:3-oxoacyl-ACP reductase family protein n=1 Tax=Oscillochloris sp. ZM17-4 TaxID=2866714 RepID=UPI001C72C2EC|nr:3-oxoacyl-ACP reductase family protein [Oscillochloris sp. ZM17-4]MBX0326978.1 3-oxoacyl-ACP reductase FabG [Oscillochloris sp. ZM17-4]
MGKLDGKVAVVTGASRGIGRAIVVLLAKEGAQVAINYNNDIAGAQEVADEIAAFGGTAMLAQADVSDSDQARAMIKKVAETWGRLDVLVNNAGITRDKSMRKLTDDDWMTVLTTNLNSVYWCTSAAMPIMIEQKYGRVINLSSYVGQAGNFGQANYAASKGGIIAFTKTAAIELAKYNITVNALAPGFTLTDMLSKVAESVQDQIKSKIPMGRFGMPEEMAKAVLFLAADADYITGQQINVNGGVFM